MTLQLFVGDECLWTQILEDPKTNMPLNKTVLVRAKAGQTLKASVTKKTFFLFDNVKKRMFVVEPKVRGLWWHGQVTVLAVKNEESVVVGSYTWVAADPVVSGDHMDECPVIIADFKPVALPGAQSANGGQCTCERGPNKYDQGGPDRYQWPKGNTYWCVIGWCEGRLACWFSVFGFCCWSRITIRQEGQQAQGVWGGWRHQLLWLGQSSWCFGVGWIQGTQGHVAPGSPFKPDRGKQCASICGQESLRHPHCEPQCLGGSVFGGHEDVWVAATICWRVLGHRPAATRSSTEWSSYYQWLSSGLWQHRQCDGLWPRVPDLHQCDLVKAPCQSNSSRLYSWSLQK